MIGRGLGSAGSPAPIRTPLVQLATALRTHCAPRADFNLALRAQLLAAAAQHPAPRPA